MKSKATVFQFGQFEFDPSQYELRRGVERQTLSPSLNRLLLLFAERSGELVTREQIADTLWESQGAVDVAAGINTAVRRLRTQLGEGNGQGVFIETVVGVGYRFARPVSVATFDEPALVEPEPVPSEPDPVPLVSSAAPTRTRLWVGAAVLLLCAAGGGWTLFSHRFARTPANPSDEDAGIRLLSRRVTFDEPDDRLTAQAISPSGAYVAFLDRAGLTVRPVGEGRDRRLALPAGFVAGEIAWAADETYLLLGGKAARPSSAAKSAGEPMDRIWLLPLNGQPGRPVIDEGASPAVAPDGRRMAFLRAQRSEIWIANADGGSPRKLAGAPSGDVFSCILWSPRGDRIVADRTDHGLPPLTGVDSSPKKAGPEPLAGQRGAVYESYDARTGALLSRREDTRFDSAALLRDGTLLYLVDTPASDTRMAVVQTDPATGAMVAEPKLVAFKQFWSLTSFSTSHLTATADGNALSAILERPSIDVYTADLVFGGSAPVLAHIARLSHRNGSDYPTAWTPDDKEVIYDSGSGGPIALLSQPYAGGDARVLASSAANPKGSRFAQGQPTPDGRWLLFLHLAPDSDRVQSIDRIPLTGGKPELLHTEGAIEEFHCSSSPVGRCVLREAKGNDALVYYALDPVSGMGLELARVPWKPSILGDWTVSPDGGTVAVADHDPLHPGIELVPLAAKDSNGRGMAAPRVLPVNGFGTMLEATWSADGKGLFVEAYATNAYALLWLPLDGHATLLRQSPDLIYAVASRDGRKIAFPGRAELTRNVWFGTRRNTHL